MNGRWTGLLVALVACGPPQLGTSGEDATSGEDDPGDPQCPARPDACWVEQFGTNQNDEVEALAVDPWGNLILVGNTLGDFTQDPSAGSYWDGFVSKRCPDGSPVWTRQFVTDVGSMAVGVAVDAEGNAYVTGWIHSEDRNPIGESDAYIAKYTPEGERAWLTRLGSETHDSGEAIALGPDGDIYVTGKTAADLAADSQGDYDIFVARCGPDGAVQWMAQLGTEGEDVSFDIALDGAGNVYLAGRAEGTLDGQQAYGDDDILVAKYDAEGTQAWARLLGTSYRDNAIAVAISPDDEVYVAGTTEGSEGLDGTGSLGEADAFLIHYRPDGTVLWINQFGTDESEWAAGVAIADDGSILVAGSTWGTFPGQTAAAEYDSFVIGFAPDGVLVSTRQFGTEQTELTRAFALDGQDQYVAGRVGIWHENTSDAFVLRVCD